MRMQFEETIILLLLHREDRHAAYLPDAAHEEIAGVGVEDEHPLVEDDSRDDRRRRGVYKRSRDMYKAQQCLIRHASALSLQSHAHLFAGQESHTDDGHHTPRCSITRWMRGNPISYVRCGKPWACGTD
jgi:hypothetical protein